MREAKILAGGLVLSAGQLALGLVELGDVGEVNCVFPIPELRGGGGPWGLVRSSAGWGRRSDACGGRRNALVGVGAAARRRKARGAGGRRYLA